MDPRAFLVKLAAVMQVDLDELREEFELDPDRWDSLAQLATIALIDEEFGITVPAESLTQCTTVGAVLELISQSIEQKAPER